MKTFFKSSICASIILMILGLLWIFQSEVTITTISYIIGAALIALGVLALIRFIKSAKNITEMNFNLDIIYGLVTVVLGIVIITKAIASILPIVLGIAIVINSASKLQYAFILKNDNNDMWKTTMIIAIVSAICGVVLLFNPFAGAVLIMKIVGIFIVVYSVLDIVSTVIIKKNVDEFKTVIDSVEVEEAEIVEEKPKKKSTKKTTKKKKKDE